MSSGNVAADQLREVWLPIPGYEGLYDASNLGQIRRSLESSRNPGRLLKPVMDNKYLIVTLCKNGLARNQFVHVSVLSAFCGVRPFEGANACHNDGNPSNPRLDNLRWASPADNQRDRERHGTKIVGADVFGAKLTDDRVREIRRRLHNGERSPQIAPSFGVSVSTIHLIKKNRIWRHVA